MFYGGVDRLVVYFDEYSTKGFFNTICSNKVLSEEHRINHLSQLVRIQFSNSG